MERDKYFRGFVCSRNRRSIEEKHLKFSYEIPKSRPGHVIRFYAVEPEGYSSIIYKIVNLNTGKWFQWNVDTFSEMIIYKSNTPLPEDDWFAFTIKQLAGTLFLSLLVFAGIFAILDDLFGIRDPGGPSLVITSIIALMWFIYVGRMIVNNMLKRKQAKKGIQKFDEAINRL